MSVIDPAVVPDLYTPIDCCDQGIIVCKAGLHSCADDAMTETTTEDEKDYMEIVQTQGVVLHLLDCSSACG